MLVEIYNFIQRKGLNAVHLRKEMEGSILTSNQVGNASHLIFHGLLKDLSEAGNVAITQKGYDFLRGQDIPKMVIIYKGRKQIKGFYQPAGMTNIKKLIKKPNYWEGEYVKTGEIIQPTSTQTTQS